MISSQPSGGDEPPRRSEGGSSGPRDAPARSITLPYDHPGRLDRHEKPRPARRDSRAGPDLRDRDWRRPSRSAIQYPQSAASIHALSRRDDRAARDRAVRDRRRLERPRDRMDRTERPERHERGDKLDRRSSWQHTSAPYIRENGHHEPNGNSHAPVSRNDEDDDRRSAKNGRAEPRFTRRPGNSFWDLMKGERPEKHTPSHDSPAAHEERRINDDRRVKHTERPRIDDSKEHVIPRRERSQGASPTMSVRSNEARQESPGPTKAVSANESATEGLTKDGDDAAESQTANGHSDTAASRVKDEEVIKGQSEAHAELTIIESRNTSTVDGLRKAATSTSTDDSHPDGSALLSTNPAVEEQVDSAQTVPENANIVPAGKSALKLDAAVSELEERRERANETDGPNAGPTTDNKLAKPSEADAVLSKDTTVSVGTPEVEKERKPSVPEESLQDSASSLLEQQDSVPSPQTEDSNKADAATIGLPGVADSTSKSVADDSEGRMDVDIEEDTKDSSTITGVDNSNVRVPNSEAVGAEEDNTRVADIGDADNAKLDVDEEMPDANEHPDPNIRREMKPSLFDNVESTAEYYLNYTGKPNDLKVEPVECSLPRPLSDPSKPELVATPQEVELHKSLASQYETLSAQVPAASPAAKKWTLSAPDPRVSLAAMIQQAELEEDIRARQAEFAERKREWLQFCKQLDDEASTRVKPKASEPSSKDVAANHSRRRSKDFEPEVHRRSRERSRAHGDVARSEAEFLEILANLEAETARDPLVRARQTSARIPRQRQGPVSFRFRSTDALVKDHSVLVKRLETDAVDDFTPEEHERFVEAYVKHPKEFGRIAEAVGRGFNECVMHYYRTKKFADYKRILQRRRKSKRGRKPKKKEADGDLPMTPSLEGTFQFDSPGTPQAQLTPTDSVVTATPPPGSIPITASMGNNVMNVPPQISTGVIPGVATTQSATQTSTAQPTFESVVGQPGAVVLPLVNDQQFAAHPSDSRIPPPVLPLNEHPSGQIETETKSSLAFQNWPPSTLSHLEHLFGLYGPRLDEIAQQIGLPVEAVRDYYEHSGNKFGVIPRVDPIDAQTKVIGPNVGFFPPRNKNVPIAKVTTRTRQDLPAQPAVVVPQPIQPLQEQRYQEQAQLQQQPVMRVQQQPPGEIPPVVQPESIPTAKLTHQKSQAPVESLQSPVEQQQINSQHSSGKRSSGQPKTHHDPAVAEVLSPPPQESLWEPEPPVKALNLSALPILPCLPIPGKLADPVEYYHLDSPFQPYRESNVRGG